MTTQELLEDTVVPALGCLTSNILFLSALPAVVEVYKTRIIGKLNLFPLAMIAPNGLAWTVYAVIYGDIWVFWTNMPGFIEGLWYVIVCMRALDLSDSQHIMAQVVVCVGCLLPVLGLMTDIVIDSDSSLDTRESVIGWIAVLILTAFYMAPLSALVKVLRMRDSSPFLVPLAATTVLNGLLWVSFGITTGEPFIWVPNAVAAVNGTIQLVCCCVFPRTAESKIDAAPADYFKEEVGRVSMRMERRLSARGSFMMEHNQGLDGVHHDGVVVGAGEGAVAAHGGGGKKGRRGDGMTASLL